MPSQPEDTRRVRRHKSPSHSVLAIDRIACTGHGICAQLLPEQLSLDEWGYPVVLDATVRDSSAAGAAVTVCPARALRTDSPPGARRA